MTPSCQLSRPLACLRKMLMAHHQRASQGRDVCGFAGHLLLSPPSGRNCIWTLKTNIIAVQTV